mgnify:CR=1 FL=1
MKHSLFRRTLSVLLCAVLVALCVVPAFAEDTKANHPILYVEGFNGAPLYKNGTEKLFMPEAQDLTGTVTSLITTLLKFTAQRDVAKLQGDINGQAKAYDDFIDAVINAGAGVFGKFACDKNGQSIEDGIDVLDIDRFGNCNEIDNTNIKEAVIKETGNELGKDMVYYFTYDWRMSLIDTAAKLSDAIEQIKADTGYDKVSLVGMSMGGALINTYTTIYGYGSVCNLTMSSSAFQGLQYIGEIFNGQMEIDGELLGGLIDDFLSENVQLSDLLSYSNIYKRLLDDMNTAFKYDMEGTSALGAAEGEGSEPKNKIKNNLLIPYFAYLPGMWTFVPDKYYESAIEYVFGPTARIGESALLVAKLDQYHLVQVNAKNNLQAAMNNGVTLSIVSHYNTHIAPVTPVSKTLTGDVTIETVGTSGGATTAPIGECFDFDYEQALYPEKNYISPDFMIDASTCMFPDKTWFIKDMKHMEFDPKEEGNNCDLFIWLANTTEQLTVESDDLYPQFLMYDRELKRLSCFYTPGDVNYDEDWTLVDVRKAMRLAAGLDETNANLEAAADMDRDKAVSNEDADSILKTVVMIQSFNYMPEEEAE